MPNLMKQNGPPLQRHVRARKPFCTTMMAMAMSGIINSSEANALIVGSHAGTGAPCGMPAHVPNKINVQNANSA